jgi:hypothetical protein
VISPRNVRRVVEAFVERVVHEGEIRREREREEREEGD